MTKTLMYAIAFHVILVFLANGPVLAQDDPAPEDPQTQGRVDATGTHFQVLDSDYLNVTLDSSEPIHITLESVPEMISMHIEAADAATSTEITLAGLLPSTTYYRYQDGYHIHELFAADDAGTHSFTQDLSEPHLVFIQPRPGTRFIPQDTDLGTWDPSTRTYTLTADATETIQIEEDNLTLDGGGHTITGSGTGYGIYLFGKRNVTITHITIHNFSYGIYLSSYSNYNILTRNTASNNYYGIYLYDSRYNALTRNTASDNRYGIYFYSYSNSNTLTSNNCMSNNYYGVYLYRSSYNVLTANTIGGSNYGLYAYDSYTNTLKENTCVSNNYYGVRLYYCRYSRVYNNNFIGNPTQAYVYGGSRNLFNLDTPIGGNYWNNWTTPDADGDGFVDNPYVFSGGADYLPWTGRWLNPPNAIAEPAVQTVSVGESAVFDGSDSYDADGYIVAYEWDFGDGISGSGETTEHVYFTEGIYTVRLIVRDNDGKQDERELDVTVVGQAPTANAGGTYAGGRCSAVLFDGSASTDDAGLVRYEWSFGDGGIGEGVNPVHNYRHVGSFTVCVTVYDAVGQGDTACTVTDVTTGECPGIYAGGSNPGVVYAYSGGSDWGVISPELGFAVLSLVDYDGDLYAGTMSTSDWDGGVGRVWRYDGGMTWILVGDSLDEQVCDLKEYNGQLYAGTGWSGGNLYRYNAGAQTFEFVGSVPDPPAGEEDWGSWDGIRAMYVRDGVLQLGDIGYDRFGRFDGSHLYYDAYHGGSCIYDFAEFDGALYAAAYGARLHRSADGITWTAISDSDWQRGNMWELEAFRERLYMSYDNGVLTRMDAYHNHQDVWTAPDGIISMVADKDSVLYLGTGGEAGYGSSTYGTGYVYAYHGSGQPALISGTMGTGVQCIYLPPKKFMLTFDDGPIPFKTDDILAQLLPIKVNSEPVKAGFFMVGHSSLPYYAPFDWEWEKGSVRDYPDVAVAVADLGHIVGNHTQHHTWFPQYFLFGPEGYLVPPLFPSMTDFVISEISQADSEIGAALNATPARIFRPPYLQSYDAVSEGANGLGFKVIRGLIADSPYGVDSEHGFGVEGSKQKARAKLEQWEHNEPAVLIFHDNRWTTSGHIGEIITYLQDQGFRLVNFDPELVGEHDVLQAISGGAHSPVDLNIIDPDGLILNKQVNEIPWGVYEEFDEDGDGHLDDFFVIPNPKPGIYAVEVVPEVGALPEDTYTLEVEDGYKSLVVAENIAVADIPEQPYLLQLTGAGVLIVGVPMVGAVSAPFGPVEVGTQVSAGAYFVSAGEVGLHRASWDWGDGGISEGAVTEPGEGEPAFVAGYHTYSRAGIYTISLTVVDEDGDSDDSVYQYVVVYDPDGGFVTGGGWINSPEGAYAADPSLTGKANFGFVSKYQHGAPVPTGQTQFQFKVADLNFHSTSYQWLVIAGPQAKFKGSGTINSGGDYGFMLSAVDGEINSGGGVDGFRIKIWDKESDEIVYDNQMDADDDAEPTTTLGGGSIVIHR